MPSLTEPVCAPGMSVQVSTLNRVALLLTACASLQMVAYLLNADGLRGLMAMTTAAPFPKVFTDVNGLETFASRFYVEWTAADGAQERRRIEPELYAKLAGPYNRRNVYGAALSYAPRLPEALWQTVFCHALAPSGALRAPLGIPADARQITVVIETKTKGRSDVWRLAPACLQ